MTSGADYSELYGLFPLLRKPGEVIEARILGVSGKIPGTDIFARGTLAGYFDNPEDLGQWLERIERLGKASGLYVGLNPPDPALLARANNRLKAGDRGLSVSDKDIRAIRYLLIDIDAVRPSGIPANDDELSGAREVAVRVVAVLKDHGIEDFLTAASGNGYHLVIRLDDLPPEPKLSGKDGLIHRALKALDQQCSDERAKVDLSVYNPARICKGWGSTGRKGDGSEDRPNRRSKIIWERKDGGKSPRTLADWPITPIEKIQAIADLYVKPEPEAKPEQKPKVSSGGALVKQGAEGGTLGRFELSRFIDHYRIPHRVDRKDSATFYILENCPFDENHSSPDACLIQNDNGAVVFKCLHDSCQGYKWADVRRKYHGEGSLKEFFSGYDPNWTPPARAAEKKKKKPDWEPSDIQRLEFTPYPHEALIMPEGARIPTPRDLWPFDLFRPKGANGHLKYIESDGALWLTAFLWPCRTTEGQVWRYARERGIWEKITDNEIRQMLVLGLKDEGTAARMKSTLEIFKAMTVYPEKAWPLHKNLIPCLNGVIDFTHPDPDAPLLKHSPDYGFRYQIQARYFRGDDPPECPKWWKFQKDVFPSKNGAGVDDRADTLQEFFGYTLTPDISFQKSLFLSGRGKNGKGVLTETLLNLLGDENVSKLTFSNLNERFQKTQLIHKLANISTEIEMTNIQATEYFKQIGSGETILDEKKYGEHIEIKPFCKLVFSMNNPPLVKDKSFGFHRRIISLKMDRIFQGADNNRNLANELKEEIDGIFYWAIGGLARLRQNNRFSMGHETRESCKSFVKRMNPIVEFFETSTKLEPEAETPIMEIYNAYDFWCRQGRFKSVNVANFKDNLFTHFKNGEIEDIGRRERDIIVRDEKGEIVKDSRGNIKTRRQKVTLIKGIVLENIF